MVKKKGKSKRVTLKDKYKMQRRVVETHRKTRKQAKRDSKAGIVKHDKTRKDPGIPNSWPFKQELLQSIKQGREKDEARKLEEKERRKNGGDLAELMANADKKRSDFDARQRGLAGTAMTATATASIVGGDEHAPSHGQSSRRAYLRSLKQVIESSDVILQVLDARDPLGTRVHPAVEAGILSHPDKRMVLVLNKIDLIPKANVADWLTHLRRSHPTVALKAGTARSGRSNESGRSSGIGRSEGEGALDTTMAVGVEGLLQLLKNYARRGGDGKKKSKTCITVGIIGYPNVGKSSILNSLKRSRAVGVSPTPGFTKSLQEVVLDGSIRLIDSPGVVFDDADGDSGAGAVLRNSVDSDSVKDPMPAIQSLLGRCTPESLMMTYGVPAFPSGPDGVMTFLAMVARSKGRVLQGGVPDKVMAARLVIKDWNRGKIPYYSVPPPTEGGAANATTTTSAAIDGGAVIVSEFADEFDVNKILEAHDKELMAGLDDVDEMDFVRMDSIVPGTTTSGGAGGSEILDYLTGNRREGGEGGYDDDDDSGSSEEDDMDDGDEDGAAANAKMEEAEDYDFGQE
jgi:nuclear GTP-binding protein